MQGLIISRQKALNAEEAEDRGLFNSRVCSPRNENQSDKGLHANMRYALDGLENVSCLKN